MTAPFCARLIPAGDREAILGDLFEEADYRTLSGARRRAWLASECVSIALGLSVERLRGAVTIPPAREIFSGLVLDGRSVLRHGTAGTLVRALVFVGSLATLVLGVELLVASLMSAAGV
jgi:hypothetical protein